jgi:hypothetical protein
LTTVPRVPTVEHALGAGISDSNQADLHKQNEKEPQYEYEGHKGTPHGRSADTDRS